MSDARYSVEYAKTGRSSCKKCKLAIVKGAGRIGKITTNPFSDDGSEMKVWYHLRCMFETLKVSRCGIPRSIPPGMEDLWFACTPIKARCAFIKVASKSAGYFIYMYLYVLLVLAG